MKIICQINHLIVYSTAELLGFDGYIPPYSTARGQDILRGVNYASAAAGIREETGQQLVCIKFNLISLLFYLIITLFLSSTLWLLTLH